MDYDTVKSFLLEQLETLNKSEIQSFYVKRRYAEDSYTETLAKMLPLDSFYEVRLNLTKGKEDDKNKLLYDFLFGYLVKVKSFEFIESDFNELFEELQFYVKTKKYVFRSIVLLKGCIFHEPISFDNYNLIFNYEYMDIFSLCFKELQSRMHTLGHFISGATSLYDSPNTIIEFKEVAADHLVLSNNRSDIENIVKAIILEHGVLKKFSVSNMLTFSYLFANSMMCQIQAFPNLQTDVSRGFKLDKTVSIKQTYDYLSKNTNFKPDTISLQRLSSAMTKKSLEDKYLDLIIALESLFPSVNSELTFRLSLYIAIMNGKSKKTFSDMKRLYSLRSKIVHGELIERDKLEQHLELLDVIIRNCLKTYISNDIDIKKMDEGIIGSILSN